MFTQEWSKRMSRQMSNNRRVIYEEGTPGKRNETVEAERVTIMSPPESSVDFSYEIGLIESVLSTEQKFAVAEALMVIQSYLDRCTEHGRKRVTESLTTVFTAWGAQANTKGKFSPRLQARSLRPFLRGLIEEVSTAKHTAEDKKAALTAGIRVLEVFEECQMRSVI